MIYLKVFWLARVTILNIKLQQPCVLHITVTEQLKDILFHFKFGQPKRYARCDQDQISKNSLVVDISSYIEPLLACIMKA